MSIVGKPCWLIFFKDLKHLAEKVYPQSQRRNPENCRDMHIAFVDSTKAYDTVNQNFSTIS